MHPAPRTSERVPRGSHVPSSEVHDAERTSFTERDRAEDDLAHWHARDQQSADGSDYDDPRSELSDELVPEADVRNASQRVAIRSRVVEDSARAGDPTRLPPSAADEVSVTGSLTKHAGDHEDHLLAHFFSSPPPEPNDALEEPYHVPMSVGSRRAMWSSVWIFGIALSGIGGYTAYQQLVMPAPVELGSSVTADLVPGVPAPIPTTIPVGPAPARAATAAQVPIEPLHAEASRAIAQAAPLVAATPLDTTPAEVPAAPAAPAHVIELPAENIAGERLAAATPEAQAPAAAAIVAPPSAAVAATAARTAPGAVAAPQAVAQVAEPEASGGTLPSYDDLVEVARGFARKGRNDQAREAFQRALDAQPNASPALAGMAYVYLNMGDRGMAKLFATRALDADPTNSQGWIVLGAALEMLGDRAGARDAYRKCATDAVGSYVGECRNLAR
jgi:hypothetical protein